MSNDPSNSLDSSGTDFAAKLTLIPDDFPRTPVPGAVSGAVPKALLVEYKGRYYALGCTPPEVFERWDGCEDLARQFADKAQASKRGKRKDMSEEAILDQYMPRLEATGWVSEAEARWVIRRAAELLGWPVPVTARHQ